VEEWSEAMNILGDISQPRYVFGREWLDPLTPRQVEQIRQRRRMVNELIADYNAAIPECVPEYHGGMSEDIAGHLIDEGLEKSKSPSSSAAVRYAKLRAVYKSAIELWVPKYSGGMCRCIAMRLVQEGWEFKEE
jgi:hypothetical protein